MLKKIEEALKKQDVTVSKDEVERIMSDGTARIVEYSLVKHKNKKLMSPSSLLKWVREDSFKFINRELLEKAQLDGEEIHHKLELADMLKGKIEAKEQLIIDYYNMLNTNKITVLKNEMLVYTSRLKLQGHIDKIALIGDKLYVIDVKTNTKVNWNTRVFSSVQTQIYKLILEDLLHIEVGTAILEVNRETKKIEFIDVSKNKKAIDLAKKLVEIYPLLEQAKQENKEISDKQDYKKEQFDIFG